MLCLGRPPQKPMLESGGSFLNNFDSGGCSLAWGTGGRAAPLQNEPPRWPWGSRSLTGRKRLTAEFSSKKSNIRGGISSRPSHVGQNYEMVINVWEFINFFSNYKGGSERQCLFSIIGECSPDGHSATLKINVFTTLDPSFADECLSYRLLPG